MSHASECDSGARNPVSLDACPSKRSFCLLWAGGAWGPLGQGRREKGGLPGSLDCSLNLVPKLLTAGEGGKEGVERERE